MPRISSLQPQRSDAERVNVFIDGQFAFGISMMAVLAHGLREGQELREEDIQEILQDDTVERAYSAALNFLSFRPRSRGEVEEYFRKKKVEPAVTDAVVQRLERVNLLDDEEFARYWIENRQTFRPRGEHALRMELRAKGLVPEIIDRALATMGNEEDAAYRAGVKKLRTFVNLNERDFARRMTAYLQRRGFSYEVSATTTCKLAEERGDTLSDSED